MKYRFPFPHSSKAADASKSTITKQIKTEYGHGATPSDTINIVLFGETGVGKSSVINLIARREVAKVSSDVDGCTMQSTRHDIEFDNMKFSIFDTIGLEQPKMNLNGYLKAIEEAYELIMKLSCAGGVHLLLFCMRGGKITATMRRNYRLFCENFCSTKVPIALTFTGLEREAEMEDWWRRNKIHIEGYGIKSDGHACITAVRDDTPGEDLKYTESQEMIRELLKKCALRNTSYSPDTLCWFATFGKDMMSLIEKDMRPKRKNVLNVLEKRCKLDPETAKKIADMMEKGDSDTQPSQPGIVKVNPLVPEVPAGPKQEVEVRNEGMAFGPDSGGDASDEEGENGRRPENGTVMDPQPSNGNFEGKTTEAKQRACGGNKGPHNVESNVARRQKVMHANKYVAMPNPDNTNRAGTPVSLRETVGPSEQPLNPCSEATAAPPLIKRNIEQLMEEAILGSAAKTVSSRRVRQGTRRLRDEPDPSAASSSIVREGIEQSKEPNSDDANRTFPLTIIREGVRRSKEEPNSDGGGRATPSSGVKESIKYSKEEPGASRATPSPGVREIRPSKKESHADKEPNLDGSGRPTLSPSVGRRSKEEPDPDGRGRGRHTPSPSVREGIKRPKEGLNLDGAGRPPNAGRRSEEEPNPDGAGRATPSPSVKESTKRSKEEPGARGAALSPGVRETRPSRMESHTDSGSNVIPYTETYVQPKQAPGLGSAGKSWSAVPSGEGQGQTKKPPNLDSGTNPWSATLSRGGSGQFKASNPEATSKSGSHVSVGGSTGQSRYGSAAIQRPPNAVAVTPTYRSATLSRGGSGQSKTSNSEATSRSGSETTGQPKQVPGLGGGSKSWSAVPLGEGQGQAKKVSNLDSGTNFWSATLPRGSSGQFKASNPEATSRSGSHASVGGSTGQLRYGSTAIRQPPNTVAVTPTHRAR